MDCLHCGAKAQSCVVCKCCGTSMCQSAVKDIANRVDELRESYRECLDVLKVIDVAEPDIKLVVESLPLPERLSGLDCFCIGASISMGLLEVYFNKPMPNGIPIGDFARNKIVGSHHLYATALIPLSILHRMLFWNEKNLEAEAKWVRFLYDHVIQ